MKNFTKAISLCKTRCENAPMNSQAALSLAEVEIEAKQYNEALNTCRQLIKQGQDSPLVWNLKGQSECGMKWFREAKTSFEVAFKQNPGDSEIRDNLAFVSGMLGEGSNSQLKEPIAPVPIPDEIASGPLPAAGNDFSQGCGAFYQRIIKAISWKPGQEIRTSEYLKIRVLDSSGVSAFSTLQFPFDPLDEEVFVNEMAVLNTDGKEISSGSVTDYYILDANNDNQASHKKLINIPVPGLQAGNEINVVLTRRVLSRSHAFPFQECLLSKPFPVRETIVFIPGKANQVRALVTTGVQSGLAGGGTFWKAREPPVIRYEPSQPAYTEFLSVLWLNDPEARWQSLVSSYLASISDRLRSDQPVREQAQKLVSGLKTPAEKISAIGRYVQKEFTYKAIEFGRRACIPNSPQEVIRNKYGDCKDLAVLLQQLLTEADIPALDWLW